MRLAILSALAAPIAALFSAGQGENVMTKNTMLDAYINGIGLLGPGLNDWPTGREVLRGGQAYLPQPTILPAPAALPPAERRRCGPIVKLSLAVGYQAASAAGMDVASLATVFSASGGDGTNCHEICEMLASDDRQISPTRFHNSVHNAAAGYWGIATGAMASSSVLCAYDASFGAGLLEAVTQAVVDRMPVLLIAADTTYPAPLRAKRPIPDEMGIGLLLSPTSSSTSIARIHVSLTDQVAESMKQDELEALRKAIPAARGLPLLQALANESAGRVVLDYLDRVRLAVDITSCR
jgi:hypothetical protein